MIPGHALVKMGRPDAHDLSVAQRNGLAGLVGTLGVSLDALQQGSLTA